MSLKCIKCKTVYPLSKKHLNIYPNCYCNCGGKIVKVNGNTKYSIKFIIITIAIMILILITLFVFGLYATSPDFQYIPL